MLVSIIPYPGEFANHKTNKKVASVPQYEYNERVMNRFSQWDYDSTTDL
jgi:hypothetical protein